MKVWFQNRRTKSKREVTEGEGCGPGNGGLRGPGAGAGEEELDVIEYDEEDDYVDHHQPEPHPLHQHQ